VPVTAIASTADPRASVAAVRAWSAHTSRSFRMHLLSGGHFAVLEQPAATHAHLRAALGG
jgi:medium-chain acyl-[acyl-carrier-protein] hydrolase